MPRAAAPSFLSNVLFFVGLTFGLVGCSGCQSPEPKPAPPATPPKVASPTPVAPPDEKLPRVMLGIDTLEANGFDVLKGKRVGLLTHPAGVNRRGVSTIDVLRNAPGVKLVALYAIEHGLYNEQPASTYFKDAIDPRTGLMVYSLYSGVGKNFRPTPAQLKDIDVLVIDLQDIGTRSYTFSGGMKSAMEICFENGKEVVVLDRPNPLGGLKVSGPPMDAALMSGVGRFRVPYVHGLTMGELARMAFALQPPGGLEIPEKTRARAKLTVVPMRGWTRSMRWPETGLTFVPTSPYVRDFAAVQGYPMTGLGCILGGFSHGVADQYPFRGIDHPKLADEALAKNLRALNLPGLQFRRVSVPNAKTGKPAVGTYIEIVDYDDWQPCDLNFWLMKMACQLETRNPFATATEAKKREFLIHVGSEAFWNDLVAKGKNIDIEAWLRTWREQAKVYQEQSKKYWLYR
jgi:uncharacterized protein YbbC (DUF1343 family)